MIATLSNGREVHITVGQSIAGFAIESLMLTPEDFMHPGVGAWIDKEVKKRMVHPKMLESA